MYMDIFVSRPPLLISSFLFCLQDMEIKKKKKLKQNNNQIVRSFLKNWRRDCLVLATFLKKRYMVLKTFT